MDVKPVGSPPASSSGSSSSGSGGNDPGHQLDCAEHPEALVCYKFTDNASVKRVWSDANSNCIPDAVFDPVEDAIKLTVGTKCGANSSGTFRFDHALQSEQMWLRYRLKQDKGLIEEPTTFKLPSAKFFVMWAGSSSCSANEFAHVNQYWRGFPQFYENCGAIGTHEKLPPWDADLQPGGETRCHYQQPAERPGKRCLFYRDVWATHTFYLDLDGAKHDGKPWVEGWVHYDDEPRPVQILSTPLVRTRQIQSIYFGPYMTGKSVAIDHPEWRVWYQDILITKKSLRP